MEYIENLVSIMVPCFNGARYLNRFFDSLLYQSYQKLQIIFVNDGSSDESEKIALEYKEKFNRIDIDFIYRYQDNKGQASAINTAIPYVCGEYLMWIDCDDYLEAEHVERKVSFLQQHPECEVVMAKGNIYKEDNLSEIVGILGDEKEVGSIFEDVLLGFRCCQCGLYMVRTKALFQVIPNKRIYESPAGQNMQLLLPVLAQDRVGYLEERLYNYVEYKSSHSHAIHGGLAWKARYDVLEDMKRNVLKDIPLNSKYKESLLDNLEMQLLEKRLLAIDEEVDEMYARDVCNAYLEKSGFFENSNGRRLYIWGKGKRAGGLEGIISKYTDIEVAGYIDSSLEKRKGDSSIQSPEMIDKEKMFILVSLAGVKQDIVAVLEAGGFEEKKDYIYSSYSLRRAVEERKDASIF